jgi:hypothetical protein
VADEHLHVYPNPTSGILYIQADHLSGSASIELIDPLGRNVYTQSAEGATVQTHIDISAFTPGVYTLLIRDESGTALTKRIVKD